MTSNHEHTAPIDRRATSRGPSAVPHDRPGSIPPWCVADDAWVSTAPHTHRQTRERSSRGPSRRRRYRPRHLPPPPPPHAPRQAHRSDLSPPSRGDASAAWWRPPQAPPSDLVFVCGVVGAVRCLAPWWGDGQVVPPQGLSVGRGAGSRSHGRWRCAGAPAGSESQRCSSAVG